jgi:hypothetical protein
VSSVRDPLDETQRNALQYLESIWAIESEQDFRNRRGSDGVQGPRGLHRVLLMPEPQVSTAKVIIGLPRANTIKRWQERITPSSAHADAQGTNDHQGIEEVQRKQAEARDTARVFAMAPAWLKTPAIQAQWQPRMEDNTAERSSLICIHFRQKPGKSEEPILQRQRACVCVLVLVFVCVCVTTHKF